MRYITPLSVLALSVCLASPSPSLQAQVNVWTYHNDNARTGANTNETILAPSNVNTNSFGKLFSYSVDGNIYAQPLYLANVAIPGQGTHNVVYVGTENDTVYAFDADGNAGSTPLWQVSLLGDGESPVGSNEVYPGTVDISPKIGITGTPVIDVTNGTLYVVSKSRLVSGGTTNYYQRLHALDITSGVERPYSPVLIQAAVPGIGQASTNALLSFNPLKQHQRSALALVNGVVYIPWASHGDTAPYHGWLMGYDENTLAQVSVFNTTPNGSLGGIWQAGNGAAADTNGNLFVMTGNGIFDGSTNNDYGDSMLKLATTNSSLALVDYFSPYNEYQLGGNGNDSDLGAGGPLLLPDAVGSATHRHLIVGAGKGNKNYGGVTIYLVDRDNMGHYNAGGTSDSQIVQYITNSMNVPNLSSPTYFNYRLYYLSYQDVIKAFSISNAVLSTTPIDKSTSSPVTWFGPTMSISANGTNNAILWLINFDHGNGATAVLYAYNAYNLSTPLYSSSQAGTRDAGPLAIKFTVPTVVNGKVYVGGQSSLVVYGNASFSSAPIITSQPQSQTVPAGTDLTLTVGVAGTNSYTAQWYFNGTAVPGANSASYSITNVPVSSAGPYYVALSNSSGVTMSSSAFVTVIGPLTNSPGSLLAPSGLVNWWPADGNGVDIFGGNNATLVNAMTYGQGESGLAFQFDGVSAYLNVGATNLPPPWTACMWVYRQTGLTNSTILMGDNKYYIKLEQYNTSAMVGITQLSYADSAFNYSVPADTWTHLTFVSTSTNVTLYANGVSQGSIATNNFPLPRSYIGAGFASTRMIDYMHGSLDEIHVFNRALDQSEISSIYSAGSAGLVRAPQFTGINVTNGQTALGLKGMTGKTFTLYSSTNLESWSPLITLSNSVGTNLYSEPVTTNGEKFYKLSQP